MKQLDIAVIIPFKNKANMTLKGLSSLLRYGPVLSEILLVSNNSSYGELEKVKDFTKRYKHINVVKYNYPFNYQAINNWGVRQTTSKIVMFLNNDIELVKPSVGLIEKMYKKAQLPAVGSVGCLLLYGDARTIQHAGVYLMPEGLAEHLYGGKKYLHALKDASHKFPYDVRKSRPLSAVTGAISLVERSKFEAVNGFNENFVIGGGDVDLCLRLNQGGYQTWYQGGGYLLHKESQSRSHLPVTFNDFYYSYLSYIKGFDIAVGDPFLPRITKDIRINEGGV